MPDPDAPPLPLDPAVPVPGLVPVAHYPGESEAMERALVVLAMESDCAVDDREGGGFAVLAEPSRADLVTREIAEYDAEASQPRPVREELPEFPPGFAAVLLWVCALLGVFLWQGRHPDRVDHWVVEPSAIFVAGEWWRAFTALFLHADLEHLLGNVGLGVLLGLWVGRSVGAWRGWAMILVSGTVGNLANAWVRAGEPFASLGASTAVFGALGLLTGVGLFHAIRHPGGAGPLRPVVPLVAGLLLLAWLGGGGPRSDVSAHLMGFLAGAVLGPALAWWSQRDPAGAAKKAEATGKAEVAGKAGR